MGCAKTLGKSYPIDAPGGDPAPLSYRVEFTLTSVPNCGPGSGLATGLTVVFPFGLSMREVEVIRLVSVGKTNAEVAERLFLSRRSPPPARL